MNTFPKMSKCPFKETISELRRSSFSQASVTQHKPGLTESASANLPSVPPPEPLSNPALTVIPNVGEISEGDHLYLICGVKGTPPVTFKWYRSDSSQPLHTTTSYMNNTSYEIPLLSKVHSGKYHCEAFNHANNVVRSELVTIEGERD